MSPEKTNVEKVIEALGDADSPLHFIVYASLIFAYLFLVSLALGLLFSISWDVLQTIFYLPDIAFWKSCLLMLLSKILIQLLSPTRTKEK